MTAEDYRTRRAKLLNVCKAEVIVLSAHREMQRAADAAYEFTQEANFRYLTGITEPDWWVIITATETVLVRPDVDEVHRLFDGSLSDEQALRISGTERILLAGDAMTYLQQLAQQQAEVFALDVSPHAAYETFVHNPAPARLWGELGTLFKKVTDCRPQLAKLRAVKSDREVEQLQVAINETGQAFAAVRQQISTYRHEYELEAEFTYRFRKNGMDGHAYTPIVAAGGNACTLHYVQNNAPLTQGELVVMDIGASYKGYAADITRTYALGDVSERHKAVHAAVQRAQKEIIELIHPGLSVRTYIETSDTIMKRELVGLGLIDTADDESFRHYFPHAISHGLGLDVHDSLGSPDVFMPGMVLTVEPGIYIPEEAIGVRIEDDILVTADGYKNLSGFLSTDL